MERQPGEGSGAGEEPVPGPGLPGGATPEPGPDPTPSAEGSAASGPGGATPDPGAPSGGPPGSGQTGVRAGLLVRPAPLARLRLHAIP